MKDINFNELEFEIYDTVLIRQSSSSSIFLINTTEGDFIVRKLAERNKTNNILRKIYNLLSSTTTSFFNEAYIYRKINNIEFQWFKFPSLKKTNQKNFIVIDFIPNNGKVYTENIDKNKLIKALFEFQSSDIFQNKFNFNATYWLARLLRNTSLEIFRHSFGGIRKKYGMKLSIRCTYLLISSRLKLTKIHPLNMHKDLQYKKDGTLNNIIINDKNEYFFIDFESTTLEKSWILIDIVDICWSVDSLVPDVKLLSIYLNMLMKNNIIKKKDIKSQIRIALMRRSISIIESRGTTINSVDKERWRNFLQKIILSNQEYNNWYACNILSKISIIQ